MKTVEDRLAALEGSAWRWRAASGVLLVGLIAAVAWGAGQKPAVSESVITRELQVVNAQGGTVFTVGANEDGDPSMRFMLDGKDAISAWASKDRVKFEVHNLDAKSPFPSAIIHTGPNIATMSFAKDKKSSYISVGHLGTSGAGMFFVNDKGEVQLRLPKDLQP